MKKLRKPSDLSRADKLYIKWLLRQPRSSRPTRGDVADFFNLTVQSVRKIEKDRGPYLTQWELERLGLERWGYDGRQIRPRPDPLHLDVEWGQRAIAMLKLRDEENMPYENIALRFGVTAKSAANMIREARQKLKNKEWGYIEKD